MTTNLSELPNETTQGRSMKHSLQEAADAVGVSKSTIYRAVKSGKLSATRNEEREYEIDPAELFRVFQPKQPEVELGESETQPDANHAAREDMMQWLRELADEQREIIASRDSEIQALREQVEAEREKADQLTTRLLEAPKEQMQELSEQVQALSEKRGFWKKLFG